MERSLDHFVSKMVNPNLAYEWRNYRLSSPRINSYKGNRAILDPFTILQGWFAMNFANFFVEPNQGLEAAIEAEVRNTINILKLNTDDMLVNLRFKVVRDYATGVTTFNFLQTYYPFIAAELTRQNQAEAIKNTFDPQ
jgi:hypothetical protein